MSAATFRYHTETINGVEIEKPMPKRLHAIIQARLQRMLEAQLQGSIFEVLPSLDMLCGQDRYVPDLVVARKDAKYTNDMLDEGAGLAIEIMSPEQTIGRLLEKCQTYLQHGTRVCWAIWPKRRQAWFCTRQETAEVFENAGGSLEVNTLDLTLAIPLRDLFRDLPETADPS